ncbi:MAG: SIMPL domain-containing protein [Opitutae bacterium]|nr:SIMPL domain-containing protein [Opitutae bacterium]
MKNNISGNAKTITIKGVGKVSAKADCVVLSMSLTTINPSYDKTINEAAQKIKYINDSICEVGFEKSDLKTTSFNVNTEYTSVKDRDGEYRQRFDGYRVSHQLKLKFDLDMAKLSQVIFAISNCPARPKLSIEFTVKDPTAINEELLRSAAANAKQKAKILCSEMDVELGKLIAISYNWGEIDIYSHTEYETGLIPGSAHTGSIDITPEDIDVSDSATFVWEIK